ncbi:MAG: prepilin peptidase, partial [Pseudomonadota bacterium]|nr:prepilin peptidase [Pseudomonadota bacterium]
MFALNSFIFDLSIVCFVGLLCWAAVSDISRFIIPNTICLGILVLFPAYVLSAPGPVDWLGNAVTASIMFGVAFLFFVFRLTGGGNVKLLVVASLTPSSIKLDRAGAHGANS